MTTATVNSKNQITLPDCVLRDLNIGLGDRLKFVKISEGHYQIVTESNIESVKGIIKVKSSVSVEAMNQAIKTKAGAR